MFHVARDDQYFADMTPWNNRDSYTSSADELAGSECETIGIDINNLQLEYPLIALVRERKARVRFLHTGVANPTGRYGQPTEEPPCAIACLDCLGDSKRLGEYARFTKSAVFGRFVILSK